MPMSGPVAGLDLVDPGRLVLGAASAGASVARSEAEAGWAELEEGGEGRETGGRSGLRRGAMAGAREAAG